MFAPTSRYFGHPTAQHRLSNGRTISYVRRRFVPPGSRFALLYEHAVSDSDRPDTVAAEHIGDPEQFWRLCDANDVIDPHELTDTAGRRIRITLPESIPGPASG